MITKTVPSFIASRAIKSYSQKGFPFPVSLFEIGGFKFHNNTKNITSTHIIKSNTTLKNGNLNKFGTSFGISLPNDNFLSSSNLNISFGKRDTKNNNLFTREFY